MRFRLFDVRDGCPACASAWDRSSAMIMGNELYAVVLRVRNYLLLKRLG